MLSGLYELGFSHVVATPHMRPGTFDNTPEDLKRGYRQTEAELRSPVNSVPLPELSLGSEHFFSSEVLEKVFRGEALPYDGQRVLSPERRLTGTLLLEFHDMSPLGPIESQLRRIQAAGYQPLIAHPERYLAFWKKPSLAERFVELGICFLLDTAALSGKYGARSKKAALQLLELGAYAGACSDAHRPSDIPLVAQGMATIESLFGSAEVDFLFRQGPTELLAGKNPHF